MREMKFQSFNFKGAETGGTFSGYASVFGEVDDGGDVIEAGAFSKSLPARTPKLLFQHDSSELIGKWLEVKEDDKGLFVKGQIFETIQRGREVLSLVRNGVLDGLSIGYKTVKAAADNARNVRRLIEVELFEISLVTFPMLDAARIDQVKNWDIRTVERVLCDAGLSRRKAKTVASSGWKAAFDSDRCDDDLAAALNKATELLRG